MLNVARIIQYKRCILLALFLTSSACLKAQNRVDTLRWRKNYKLTWDDFRQIPDSSAKAGAVSYTAINYTAYYTSDTTLLFVVDNIFFRNLSWVKPSWKNDYSLNHEQGHFDISEIYARKLKSALQDLRIRAKTDRVNTKDIYNNIRAQRDSVQMLYDKETTNPINRKKQEEWDRKIKLWLRG